MAACDAFWYAIDRKWQLMYRKLDLDRRRKLENLIPGTALRPRPDDDRLPILLVARDGKWTILAPAGTGMMIWPSLVSVAPRVGGQREQLQHQFESRRSSFPHDWPMTHAGDAVRESAASAAEGKWNRQMPEHRVKFEAVGTSSPWRPQWSSLVDGEAWLLTGAALGKLTASTTVSSLAETIGQARIKRGLAAAETRLHDAFIPVCLTPNARGTPTDNAEISVDGVAIGYVTTGRYSLSTGSGQATAIVSLRRWLEGDRQVMYKNETSSMLYSATLSL